MITPKEAFKIGFCTKLAAHGIGLKDVIAGLEAMEKNSASVGSFLAPAMAIPALSAVVPAHIGQAAGAQAANLSEDEMLTLSQARKKLLIRQYKQLIAQRQAELENRRLSQAKREA